MKKNIFKFSLLVLCLSFVLTPSLIRAEEKSLNVSVSVLERKSTDTINDFDYSTVNNVFPMKQVLGISTQRNEVVNNNVSLFQKIINLLKGRLN